MKKIILALSFIIFSMAFATANAKTYIKRIKFHSKQYKEVSQKMGDNKHEVSWCYKEGTCHAPTCVTFYAVPSDKLCTSSNKKDDVIFSYKRGGWTKMCNGDGENSYMLSGHKYYDGTHNHDHPAYYTDSAQITLTYSIPKTSSSPKICYHLESSGGSFTQDGEVNNIIYYGVKKLGQDYYKIQNFDVQ